MFYTLYLKDELYFIIRLDEKYYPVETIATSFFQSTSVYDGNIQFHTLFEGVSSQAYVPIDRPKALLTRSLEVID
jgi:hypothetical protein